MELILKKDIPELGFKNDIINVKNGYGRNYLIPNKFAIIANDSNKKILRENLKQPTHKIEKIKNDATKLSNRIGDLILDIPVKVGKEKKIFGNVTKNQISNMSNILSSNSLIRPLLILFSSFNLCCSGTLNIILNNSCFNKLYL